MIDMDTVVATEKQRFEEHAEAGTGEWCSAVVFFRDGEVYFVLMCADGNRDPLLRAATLMIRVAEPDAAVLVFDSYHVTEPTKVDGTKWGPGSMQQEVENQGPSAHLVGEALNFVGVDVTGSVSCCFLSYTREGNGVVWGAEDRHSEEDDYGLTAGGVIVDALRQAFKEEPMLRTMLREVGGEEEMQKRFGYSLEQARAGALAVALKHWLPTGLYAAVVGVMTEAEAQVLMSILPGAGISVKRAGDDF